MSKKLGRDTAHCDEHTKKPAPFSEWIRRGIMIVCACTFLFGAAWIVRSIVHYYRADELYGNIADNIFDSSLGQEEADDEELYSDSLERMKANLAYLKSQNPDIYGYIHIDGTRISFPVVKGEDNEYYLKRAYNKEFMVCGAIFADYRLEEKLEDNRNTVLYGHNMLDGNMFNNVMLFLQQDVFNSKLIEIYTEHGVYTYEPFAICKTTYDAPYYRMDFSSGEDFVSFCEEMQSNSIFNKGMSFTEDDKIITLSTCTPSSDVEWYHIGRYALHAKLVEVEE